MCQYIFVVCYVAVFIYFPGNVPCPIVYGAVVDSACLVWEMASGERGACSLYDVDVFRKFYHGKLLHKICHAVVTACKRLAVHTKTFSLLLFLNFVMFMLLLELPRAFFYTKYRNFRFCSD
jgi:hypothetical protein